MPPPYRGDQPGDVQVYLGDSWWFVCMADWERTNPNDATKYLVRTDTPYVGWCAWAARDEAARIQRLTCSRRDSLPPDDVVEGFFQVCEQHGWL